MIKRLYALAAATLFAMSAHATDIPVTYCNSLTTLGAFESAFADPAENGSISEGIAHCLDGDKQYEYWGTTLALDTAVEFTNSATNGSHTFTQKNLTQTGNFGLAYAIEVVPSSPFFITNAGLEISVNQATGFSYLVRKEFWEPLVTACDHSIDFCFDLVGVLEVYWNDQSSKLIDTIDLVERKLWVMEYFTITVDSSITNGDASAEIYYARNFYNQSLVPTPAALALLVFGVAGIGVARRWTAAR
jgi:hypothetical protein